MEQFIEIIKAIIYGIVEGITEWLPISSTGHLILVESLMPFRPLENGIGVSEAFFGMFDVVIQLGAILAVVVLFWGQIWPFALTRREREETGETGILSYFKKDIWILWFDDVFDELFYNPTSVAIALIVFGVAFIVVESWNKGRRPRIRRLSQITFQTAFLIGVFQLIAAVSPGTSRSGATIVGALLIGVSRTVAAEYTFFLAIPVMFGASLLKVVKFGFAFTSMELTLLIVGTVVSFIVSLFVLRFLMGYIKKHDFKVFGWYRIALGAVVLLYFGLAA